MAERERCVLATATATAAAAQSNPCRDGGHAPPPHEAGGHPRVLAHERELRASVPETVSRPSCVALPELKQKIRQGPCSGPTETPNTFAQPQGTGIQNLAVAFFAALAPAAVDVAFAFATATASGWAASG